MRIWIGTSGFSYPEWKGSFYPADLPAKKMLPYYSERFPTVEINNTFYRMPSPDMVEGWTSQVPEEFRFILKAPQRITHKERLKDSGDSLAAFVRAAEKLGPRKGPFLFQLPPFSKVDVPRLTDFLALIPEGERAAFEFRHESWFNDEVYAALRVKGAALCISDTEKLSTPFVATASWGYLRLREMEYGEAELQKWADQVRAQQWTECFIFLKHEDAGIGPRLAKRLMEILGC
jgi:uncharacterized protein YecE (DUF72 family)